MIVLFGGAVLGTGDALKLFVLLGVTDLDGGALHNSWPISELHILADSIK